MPVFNPLTLDSGQPVPLSPIEDLSWRVEEHRSGAFRVATVLRLDGCIEHDVLAVALHRLQARHPKLRSVIGRASDGRRCYEFDEAAFPIPFAITDYDGAASPWREETRRLMQTVFSPSGPFAAVGVLRNRTRGFSELILCAHHGIADGLSAIMLVNDLLTEYANAESSPEAPPRPALRVITAARARRTGAWMGPLWLFRRYLRIQREERRLRQTRLPELHGITPQSQWVHWVFSREDTMRLVRRCRKEGASLNAAMVAAGCCGLVDCLSVPAAVFKCQFPFDVRHELKGPAGPVTAQDLGSFVSIMNAFYEIKQRPVFWDLARRVHQDVEAFVQRGGPSFFYNLATTVVSRMFASAAPVLMPSNGKRVTLFATSYGVLNIRDTYGSLTPRECTLIFNNHGIGPALLMEGLVMGQRLNIGFAADGLEPAFWERLQAAVHCRLAAAADAGKAGDAAAIEERVCAEDQ